MLKSDDPPNTDNIDLNDSDEPRSRRHQPHEEIKAEVHQPQQQVPGVAAAMAESIQDTAEAEAAAVAASAHNAAKAAANAVEEDHQHITPTGNINTPPNLAANPDKPTAVAAPQAKTPTKPHNKVSPLNAMQKKLNFIPKSQRGSLNTQYLATLPGVLKIAEIVLGFVAFVLAICADRGSTGAAWTEHITFETTIVATVLLLGYVIFPHFTIEDERNRNGLVVLEFLFYGSNTIAYFISVWLMVHLSASWKAEGRGAAIMGAILNVALTVLYGIETFVKLKQWKGEEITAGKPVQHPNGQHFPTNAELSRDPEAV